MKNFEPLMLAPFTALTIFVGCGRLSEQDAEKSCTALPDTGLVTECLVNDERHSVDFRINTNPQEAQKMCSSFVVQTLGYTRELAEDHWWLRVFPPSGSEPMAMCPFNVAKGY